MTLPNKNVHFFPAGPCLWSYVWVVIEFWEYIYKYYLFARWKKFTRKNHKMIKPYAWEGIGWKQNITPKILHFYQSLKEKNESTTKI